MKNKQEDGLVALTGESVERTIRHFAENGGLHLTAYYEQVGQQLPCKIDATWEIHGVTLKDNEFSFVASKAGQVAIKFYTHMREFIESVKRWFVEEAKNLTLNMKHVAATIPKTIVFFAGPTEYVALKAKAA